MPPFARRNSSSDESEAEKSNSEDSGSESGSASEAESAASKKSSASHVSNKSGSKQGSPAASPQQASEAGSSPSHRSAASSRSSSRSGSPASNRSGSAASNRSGSAASNRSGSPASNRSGSPAGNRSGSPASNRSGSPASKRSGSRASNRSGSPASNRSKSAASNRSGSATPEPAAQPAQSEDEDDTPKKPASKKKTAAIVDDSGSEDEKGDKVNAQALFGEADDISDSSDNEKKSGKAGSDDEEPTRKSDSEREEVARTRDDDDDNEDADKEKRRDEGEEEVEPPPETRIDVEIPRITADMGKETHFVKLPNFLSVEPRPFDPQTYEDEVDEEETLDEEGRARLKLKVENTIRWRTIFDKEGNAVRESNARMIRWSDGSLSMCLGSEVFDVYKQPLQGDFNHLFIRQGTGLQGQAVFRTKLTFRPHSTDSFTHRKMTMSLADRSTKGSAIKILGTVGADPEAHRGEMIKKEEDRLKASIRRESKQKRMRERSAAGRGLHASYLEPDREEDSEDEGAISLAAIKNKYKKGGAALRDMRSIYSSDEDASDIETRKAKRLERAKALQDSDDDEDDERPKKSRVISDSEED